jgi:hypothetical protein
MIGRGALSNPAIFDFLRNKLGYNNPSKTVPGISELKEEYSQLHSCFDGQRRYRDNFLRVAGKRVSIELY